MECTGSCFHRCFLAHPSHSFSPSHFPPPELHAGPGSPTTPPLASHSHEKPDSENIPPGKHHHQLPHNSVPKPEPEAKTRGEGDGRGSEKVERRPERPDRPDAKSEPLAKANGVHAGPEPASEPGSPFPEGPRVPGGGERPAQPNGWQYSSPSRPGSTAFPPQDSESGGHRRSFPPRANPDKIAQRKSSMTQLQQWVTLRRGIPPPEDLRRCGLGWVGWGCCSGWGWGVTCRQSPLETFREAKKTPFPPCPSPSCPTVP